jgi:hypothetical protein
LFVLQLSWFETYPHADAKQRKTKWPNQIFQNTVGIPMGTNCAPLLADLFLYSYEAEFIPKLLHTINLLLWPSIQHLGISTMFYRSTMISFYHMLILYTCTPVNVKLKTPQNHLLHAKHRCWRNTNNSVV